MEKPAKLLHSLTLLKQIIHDLLVHTVCREPVWLVLDVIHKNTYANESLSVEQDKQDGKNELI